MRSYTSKRQQNQAAPVLRFELDGEVFTGEGSVSMMDLSEFARLASVGMDTTDPRAGAILADIYLALLGENEYQRFRAHCRRNGTDGETLMNILGDLASEEADRPTDRSSDSSDGPPNAAGTARVVSFSRGTVAEVPSEATAETETAPRKVVSYG
ncbi:hypothetical protein [Nonomuraea rhodomycinica]|uniref:Tail assembly chaperone n=1 Tax=Nonomuraea rhodomycinica TaxID=1712872 RepID=A0A7Y6MGA6_9ACTN|nr:hypothetical protein [Nonomuraea rhodomycinica]NUW45541.1 hypothetical protein [Nonomuraea rhodomycinica]